MVLFHGFPTLNNVVAISGQTNSLSRSLSLKFLASYYKKNICKGPKHLKFKNTFDVLQRDPRQVVAPLSDRLAKVDRQRLSDLGRSVAGWLVAVGFLLGMICLNEFIAGFMKFYVFFGFSGILFHDLLFLVLLLPI